MSDHLAKITVPGTDLQVSSICYGAMGCGTRIKGKEMEAVLDAYVNYGGNFFDTAHCYAFWMEDGLGASERSLGQYLRARGIRDSVIVATKGAHPPVEGYRDREDWMSAACVRDDIDDSLSRLGTDYIDLYWLHRDNPAVPVAEIVDFLNQEVESGRIRYFGGSNWKVERLNQANAYARANGKAGFVASQPSWSLAWAPPFANDQMVVDDSERAAYIDAGDIAVIPYNSTGKGFFATGTAGDRYDNNESFRRLAACRAVAQEIGASPTQVALAWLIHQECLTIPIIGTCDLDHLVDALGAGQVALSAEQVQELSGGRA